MNAIFTNDSEIEKVTTFTGFGAEKRTRRSTLVIVATAVMLALAIVMVFMIPGEYRVIAGLGAAVLFGGGIVMMWKKAPGGKSDTPAMSGVGLIRTGDSERFHYEFYENSFSVTKDEKKEYEYSSVVSVRDIGGAFQIKTAEASYTVKKSGFPGDGAKEFKPFMESCGITVK